MQTSFWPLSLSLSPLTLHWNTRLAGSCICPHVLFSAVHVLFHFLLHPKSLHLSKSYLFKAYLKRQMTSRQMWVTLLHLIGIMANFWKLPFWTLPSTKAITNLWGDSQGLRNVTVSLLSPWRGVHALGGQRRVILLLFLGFTERWQQHRRNKIKLATCVCYCLT